MTVKSILVNAKGQIKVRCLILRNPFFQPPLYVGAPEEMPQQFFNRQVTAWRYDDSKQRLILRIKA